MMQILVVDDEADGCLLFEQRFRREINMPGISGPELLRCVKHDRPAPPPAAMMITANGDADSYQKAMRLGANDFLTKPLNFAALRQKLIPLEAA